MTLAASYVLGYRVQAAVIVAALVAPIVGVGALAWWWRRTGERLRALAVGGLTASSVVLVALVLSPDAGRRRSAACSFALDLGGSLWEGDQRTVNVLMFLPLGSFLVLVARSRRRRVAAVAVGMALPVLVELVQRTPLVNRTCDVTDLVDNWTGLVVGVVLGLSISLLISRVDGKAAA